jgi:pimeloyl-ACP methyl ester carboxylesterase
MPAECQIRVHGDATLPTLIYLPGLHGDWTLVSSFRAAAAGRVRFLEFAYSLNPHATLDDYANDVLTALNRHAVTDGWLLGESFGSQIAWALLQRNGAAPPNGPGIQHPASGITFHGLVLAGGFVQHPWPWGAQLLRWQTARTPGWLLQRLLIGYERYAGFRHRHAPETRASIREFVERRRAPGDAEAIQARLKLIAGNDPRPIARCVTQPVHYLAGLVDPLVPFPLVRHWLRRHCPGYRGGVTVWNADHNILATQPARSAAFVLKCMAARR